MSAPSLAEQRDAVRRAVPGWKQSAARIKQDMAALYAAEATLTRLIGGDDHSRARSKTSVRGSDAVTGAAHPTNTPGESTSPSLAEQIEAVEKAARMFATNPLRNTSKVLALNAVLDTLRSLAEPRDGEVRDTLDWLRSLASTADEATADIDTKELQVTGHSLRQVADLLERLDHLHKLDHSLADQWLARAEAAEQQLAAAQADARRYLALHWADGQYSDSPHPPGDRRYSDGVFEYKPAGYDGAPYNRYYLGSIPSRFRELCDRLVLAMDAAQSQEPSK